ncbi:MAG: dihydropteroate synthase [Latescibacteria bacterium DG_63]|nr:MAG: dihydropteroate synthase [Latescibacteria bacterium DG_63]
MLHIRGADLDLSERTYIAGILNVTPDSFSDGGKFVERDTALKHAERMVEEGADLIDVGGESTRPYAAPVGATEEKARVIPVISMLSKRSDVIISVDTSKASVARAALDAGAHMINDVSALRFDPDLANVAAEYEAGLVLMHMKGTPRTMQENPEYDDLFAEITSFLNEAVDKACKSGVCFESIMLDPGIGFGKKLEHNLAILKNLTELKALKRPIMVGPSRKSFIGNLLNLPVEERTSGTLAAVAVSIFSGASVVRVHDVKQAKEAAVIVDAIMRS